MYCSKATRRIKWPVFSKYTILTLGCSEIPPREPLALVPGAGKDQACFMIRAGQVTSLQQFSRVVLVRAVPELHAVPLPDRDRTVRRPRPPARTRLRARVTLPLSGGVVAAREVRRSWWLFVLSCSSQASQVLKPGQVALRVHEMLRIETSSPPHPRR